MKKITKEEKLAIQKQKLAFKQEKKIEKKVRQSKKFKARIIEQEKDPFKKSLYFKLTPKELDEHLKKERQKNKSYKLNARSESYMNNLYQKDKKVHLSSIERKRFSFQLFSNSKVMQYFYGVGKEKKRVRWIKTKQLFIDSKQSLYFIIVFAIIFVGVDIIMSLLRYFHVI